MLQEGAGEAEAGGGSPSVLVGTIGSRRRDSRECGGGEGEKGKCPITKGSFSKEGIINSVEP